MTRAEYDERLIRSLYFRERGYSAKRAAALVGLGVPVVAATWRMISEREMAE